MSRKVTILWLLMSTSVAADETQVGPATVIDGDTLKIYGVSHRLKEIDAPELRQVCRRDGVEWLCGAESAQHLRKIIRSRDVRCVTTEKDGYGRMLSTCFVGRRNLNAEMVGSGYALAYRKYGMTFVDYEEHAKQNQLGLWAGSFTEPWRYRSQTASAQVAPDGCEIKGNINSKKKRLYHKPGDRSYAKTVVSPAKGERWFCSEEDAVAAGWEPAWGK